MKKIAVITGTRAEYGYLKPLMNEIEKDLIAEKRALARRKLRENPGKKKSPAP